MIICMSLQFPVASNSFKSFMLLRGSLEMKYRRVFSKQTWWWKILLIDFARECEQLENGGN